MIAGVLRRLRGGRRVRQGRFGTLARASSGYREVGILKMKRRRARSSAPSDAAVSGRPTLEHRRRGRIQRLGIKKGHNTLRKGGGDEPDNARRAHPPAAPVAESLLTRVLRQARSGQIDADRLLGHKEATTRKWLDKMATDRGRRFRFAADLAYTITTSPDMLPDDRRDAEVALATEAIRWRRDVKRFGPKRLGEFDRALKRALQASRNRRRIPW